MYCNIMETYIKFTEQNILDYLKNILEEKFDRKIAVELTKTYINTRYYGYGNDGTIKSFSKVVYNSIKLQYEKLKRKFPKKDEIIAETFFLFKYIFYIDGLKKDKTIEQVANAVSIRRIKKYNKQKEQETKFVSEFIKRVESDNTRRKEFLKKFDTDKFDLVITKNSNLDFLYDVSMKSNLKFKEVFKEEAIEQVFNKRISSRR